MWSEEQKIEVDKYTVKILNDYYKQSILNDLTTILKNEQIIDPITLCKKFNLPPITKNKKILSFWQRVQKLSVVETQYIIDKLNKFTKNVIEYKELPNKEIIDEAIFKLPPYRVLNFMIVPVTFSTYMHSWGIKPEASHHTITLEDSCTYYDYYRGKIKIIWLNKFIKRARALMEDIS